MSAGITLEHILAFQGAYIRCIDGDDLLSWPDLFVDDCLYRITTSDNQRAGLEAGVIYANSKGMLVDRVVALQGVNIYEKQSYRHILGLPYVVANSGSEASSETPFLVVRIMHDGKTDVFATGVYLDTYRLEADEIRLSKRIVVCDSSRIDTLIALPL